MKHPIQSVHAHEILDSRGNPTLKATVLLRGGAIGSASVPSGASTGVHEALELRDDDSKRYDGKGVLKAVRHVNGPLAKLVHGRDALDQRGLDDAMRSLDGTPNKSRLGANAILAVSLACAYAVANARKLPLYRYLREAFDLKDRYEGYRIPYPTMNILNGGADAGWTLDLQECMIIPQQKQYRERLRCGAEVFHALGRLLKAQGFATLVGDEGGYAVKLKSNASAWPLIGRAVEAAGYRLGKDVMFGVDAASSEFYNAKTRRYELKTDGKSLDAEGMIKLYESWAKKYPLIMLEDGLAQDDWSNWQTLTKRMGGSVSLVGDDLFVTNVERLKKGIESGAANAILIKVNQIGTLSETIDTVLLAQRSGYKIYVSHRSGETADTTIADLAVAIDAEHIKTGSLSRSERLAKYNRLLEIDEEEGRPAGRRNGVAARTI
jgi:enolase